MLSKGPPTVTAMYNSLLSKRLPTAVGMCKYYTFNGASPPSPRCK